MRGVVWNRTVLVAFFLGVVGPGGGAVTEDPARSRLIADALYRLVTTEGVSTVDTELGTFLKVEPEAIRRLTAEAMHDIAHFLRPGHLQQLHNILDDPEASDNDRFVATDLLLEAANFHGPSIMRTSSALGLRSESSTRFEKGLDRNLIPLALDPVSSSHMQGAQSTGQANCRRKLHSAPLKQSTSQQAQHSETLLCS